jgi:hypothetical protein
LRGNQEGSWPGLVVLDVQKRTAANSLYFGCLLLSLGEHAAKGTFHFLAILGRVIPVDRALQAIAEGHFRFPSEQFFCEGIVGHAI